MVRAGREGVGAGCERSVMGLEGAPQGVEGERRAMGVKEGRCESPVPPIIAMWTGPRGGGGVSGVETGWWGGGYRRRWLGDRGCRPCCSWWEY